MIIRRAETVLQIFASGDKTLGCLELSGSGVGSKISAIFCVILAQLIILKALFLVFFLKSKSIVKGKKS